MPIPHLTIGLLFRRFPFLVRSVLAARGTVARRPSTFQMEARADLSASLATSRADAQRLKIGQAHSIGPLIAADLD
jgi:hypothetical protein